MIKKSLYLIPLFMAIMAIGQSGCALIALAVQQNKTTTISEAEAIIKPWLGAQAGGKVTLSETARGLKFNGVLTGLTGEHGFHIYDIKSCDELNQTLSALAWSSPHFNPTKARHGHPDSGHNHLGDLHNISASGKTTRFSETYTGLSLKEGSNSIMGKALVIDQNPDDYSSQPNGGVQNPIACGMIVPK